MKPNAPPPQLVMSPVFWPIGPYPEEALGHFEHQLGDRLGLAVDGWTTAFRPVSDRCRADAIASIPFAGASFSS